MTEYTVAIGGDEAELLEAIAAAAERAGVDWVVTGAMARHLVFGGVHGCRPGRSTKDWDLGVQIGYWAQFATLESHLVEDAGFRRDSRQRQRLHGPSGGMVDLIPFGGVEAEDGGVYWGKEGEFHLNVAGFQEAYAASYHVRLTNTVTARVVSPPGLAILKVIAWHDRHLEDDRDAEDLAYLLHQYHHLVSEKLYGPHLDAMERVDYDVELAGARVLGKEAGVMAGPGLHRGINELLAGELGRPEESRLLGALGHHLVVKRETGVLELLRQFGSGWREGKTG